MPLSSPANRRLLSVVAASFLGLMAPLAQAQTSPAGLQIEVALEGTPRRDGELRFTAVLSNVGKNDIELPANPGWDREGGLELRIAQVNGRVQTAPREADNSMRSTVRAEGKSAMTLKAGHGLVLFRTIDAGEAIPAPGTYRATVTYRGPDNQLVTSEPVEFVVVP